MDNTAENPIVAETTSEQANNNTSATSNGDRLERIRNLKEALETVKTEVKSACNTNIGQIIVLIIACVCVLVTGLFLGKKLFLYTNQIPDYWQWKILYIVFTRFVLVASAFYVASFCFKLLKSYLHIYQRNSHRLIVISSMASLVESSSDAQREKIYEQLLDIIVKFDKTGLLKDDDFNKNIDNKSINEVISELLKKGINAL